MELQETVLLVRRFTGINNVKNYVPINPFPSKWVLRALIDFTLSNARRFYTSMGNLLDRKGLRKISNKHKQEEVHFYQNFIFRFPDLYSKSRLNCQ